MSEVRLSDVRMSRRERGSGTVLSLALLLVIGAAGVAGLSLAQALQLKHRVQSAADLSAIAAAQAPGDACASAESIAAANGTRLVGCWTEDEDTLVRVEADAPSLLARVMAAAQMSAGPISASARASRAAAVSPSPEESARHWTSPSPWHPADRA